MYIDFHVKFPPFYQTLLKFEYSQHFRKILNYKCHKKYPLSPYVYFLESNKKLHSKPQGVLSMHLLFESKFVHLPVLCGCR